MKLKLNQINEKIEEYERNITTFDMSYSILAASRRVRILHHFSQEITRFHEKFPNRILDINRDSIIAQSLERSNGELGWFIQCFGGKFNKKVNQYENGIDFTQKIAHPLGYSNEFLIEISCVEPPPSCKIEEYDKEVPATVVKMKRLICEAGKEDEPEPLPVEPDPELAPVEGESGVPF